MKIPFSRRLVYILALGFILPTLNLAQADAPADAGQRSARAYAELRQLIAKRSSDGTLPKLSNPTEAAVLNAFWDMALIGVAPYSAADLGPLLDIYDKQKAVLGTYVFFGKDKADTTQVDTNMVAFQNETSRASLILISLTSALTEAITDFVTHLPKDQFTDVQRDGLKKMRTGYFQFLAGVHKIMTDPRLSAANRMTLAKAVADNLPVIADGMAPADRRYLAAALEPRIPLLPPPEQLALDKAVAEMLERPCVNLCAIP